MVRIQSKVWAVIVGSIVLAACAPAAKKSDVIDLYQQPTRAATGNVRPVPSDNDSYYTQPTGIKGCTTINDLPSCGGG